MAQATAGATLCLIVAGGLVTNTGASLAVPDWPTTFGYNLFLFPWSRMAGAVLLEHSHRLLGALVGALTLGLGVTLWLTEPRRGLRTLGALAVALVCAQGLLGGLRVVLRQDVLAILHGCLAQAFFALTVALTVLTSPVRARPGLAHASRDARALWRLSTGVAALIYGQIVLGALTTHQGWALVHVGGAVAVVVTVAALVGRILALPACGGVGMWARALGFLLILQLSLGIGAYVARFTGLAVPGGQLVVVALPVVHRAVGALLLGATVALALALRRPDVAAATPPRAVVDRRLTSHGVPV